MHLVFATNHYRPMLGGSVQFTERLAHALLKKGHRVTIITKADGADGFHDFSGWKAKAADSEFNICRFHGFSETAAVMKTGDVVVTVEMSIQWLLRALRVGRPFLVTHHTNLAVSRDYGSETIPRIPLYRRIQRIIGRCLPSVACSGFIARQWGPHVTVLPNPYDPEVFHRTDVPRDLDFLFAGRLSSEKGLPLFIAAAERVLAHSPDARFGIAGTGPQEEEVKKEIASKSLENRITFFGHASPETLASLYNRSRCVVVPSLWKEPFGLIPLEAMACGSAVICSDQPGLREASGGLADYFPTGNIDQLSASMIRRMGTPVTEENLITLEDHLRKFRSSNSAECLLEKIRSIRFLPSGAPTP